MNESQIDNMKSYILEREKIKGAPRQEHAGMTRVGVVLKKATNTII